MNGLPPELLGCIIEHLSLPDRLNLRQVNRYLSYTSYPYVIRHLSLLNTAWNIRDFTSFLNTTRGSRVFTKKLTIYHARWPVCTREEWEVHPLLRYEIHPRALTHACSQSEKAAAQMYQSYKEFISTEQQRRLSSDMALFRYILGKLPSLRAIAISHVRSWDWNERTPERYSLQRRIRISPLFNDSTHPVAQNILAILHGFPTIKELHISGQLHLRYIDIPRKIPNITSLTIESLLVLNSSATHLRQLFTAFPNLEHLSVGFAYPGGSLSLRAGGWKKLRTLQLQKLSVTVGDLLHILATSLHLENVRLEKVTLSSGLWRDFLSEAQIKRINISFVK